MAGSVKYFLLEWFIKTDTGTTITTNYFVRVSIPFKVRKLGKKKKHQTKTTKHIPKT